MPQHAVKFLQAVPQFLNVDERFYVLQVADCWCHLQMFITWITGCLQLLLLIKELCEIGFFDKYTQCWTERLRLKLFFMLIYSSAIIYICILFSQPIPFTYCLFFFIIALWCKLHAIIFLFAEMNACQFDGYIISLLHYVLRTQPEKKPLTVCSHPGSAPSPITPSKPPKLWSESTADF